MRTKEIQFTGSQLVGDRVYSPGDVATLAEETAVRLVLAGKAGVPMVRVISGPAAVAVAIEEGQPPKRRGRPSTADLRVKLAQAERATLIPA